MGRWVRVAERERLRRVFTVDRRDFTSELSALAPSRETPNPKFGSFMMDERAADLRRGRRACGVDTRR
jgi:hypothetical protein